MEDFKTDFVVGRGEKFRWRGGGLCIMGEILMLTLGMEA
jgi:hypothetical protein